MCVFVCVHASFQNRMSKFIVHVSCFRDSSFFGCTAIHYLLPVLWMTSCLHIMADTKRCTVYWEWQNSRGVHPPKQQWRNPSPPLLTGVRAYNPRKKFEIKDVRRWVLEHFGHKNQHLYEPRFLTVSCNFRISSKCACRSPHCEKMKSSTPVLSVCWIAVLFPLKFQRRDVRHFSPRMDAPAEQWPTRGQHWSLISTTALLEVGLEAVHCYQVHIWTVY